MPSPSDPITVWHGRMRLASAAAVIAAAVSAVWAWWPRPALPAVDATLRGPHEATSVAPSLEPFDREAFAAAVWNPPPAPARSAEHSPTSNAPPPLRLQLIGIARDSTPSGEDVLRAALYDPDTDKLHILAAGERVREATIIAIGPDAVQLETGGRATELRLRKDEAS